MIDRALWEAAQARREYNRRMSKRNAKREYLLRGRVKCGCGASMVGTADTRGPTYRYRCAFQNNRFVGLEKMGCREKAVRGDVLESFAWKYVLNIFNTAPADFEKALRDAQATERAAIEPKREELTTLLEMIKETEGEADELTNALKKAKKGGIMESKLQVQIDEVEKRYATQTRKRDELRAALDARTMTDENIAAAMRFREDVVAGMQNATNEDKRRTFELLKLEVTVKDGQARAKCLIPLLEREIDLRTLDHARWRCARSFRPAAR
jgi:site-specific DNA recombinase